MQAFRSITLFVLGHALAQTSCRPQGEVPRVVHPPFNMSQRTSAYPSASPVTPVLRTRPGLPQRCHREVRVKDLFCISCDEGGVDIERCYAFQGMFDDAKNCVYSAEFIKCLNVAPPFALNIAIKGSLEKSLLENTRLWQESLRAIARPQLTPELQASLEDGLAKTSRLVQVLIKARKPPQWLNEEFPGLTLPLQKAVEQLQHNKERGQLKLLPILEVSRMMLEASGTPASLLGYWEALSVEGLEEPGE